MDTRLSEFQIPVGFKDILPLEAQLRRKLKEGFFRLFNQWSYQEIIPPCLEYYEQLRGSSKEEELFKLIEPSGRVLALRPDLTTPIARMAATHLKDNSLPIRLCYFGNAYRYEGIQVGRQREFEQAGVELLGAPGVGADAEMVALAVESLRLSGLADFQLGIGQVAITHGLLEDVGVPAAEIENVKLLMTRKDFVGLEEKLLQLDLPKERGQEIRAIFSLRGGGKTLDKIKGIAKSETITKAIEDLKEVYSALEVLGLTKHIFFDFSILRDFDYYTGIVFEGYAAGFGYPICGGGRYDGLLGKFGWAVPAVGFAIGIDRLVGALPKEEKKSMDVLVVGGNLADRLQEANLLRKQGLGVEVEILDKDREEIKAYQLRKNIAKLVEVKGEKTDG
ncbi:MAG: ATP phosphoribosyltransferase regulatory subunit [Bacillota bacterium]